MGHDKKHKTLAFQNGVGSFSTTACGGRNNSCRRFYGARQAGAGGEDQYRAWEGTTSLTRDELQSLINIFITGTETHEGFCSCSSYALSSLTMCFPASKNLPIPTYGNSTPYLFSMCPRSSRVWSLIDSTDPNVLSVTHKEGWRVKWLHRGFTSIIRI